MADQFEPFRKTLGAQKVNTFLSKFGLGPDYVPKAPPVYECPQCHGKKGRVREDHPDTDMNEMNLHCPDCGYVGDPPRPLSESADPFEAYVRQLISSYEEMASDVWNEYDLDEVERQIGKRALETLLNYDLDNTPDGGEPVEQIVSLAKQHRRRMGEADVLPRKMGPCSTPMPRVKRPKRRQEDAVEDLVNQLLEDGPVRACVECAKVHPELVPPGDLSHGLCRRHFIAMYGEMGERMAASKPDEAFPPDLGQ